MWYLSRESDRRARNIDSGHGHLSTGYAIAYIETNLGTKENLRGRVTCIELNSCRSIGRAQVVYVDALDVHDLQTDLSNQLSKNRPAARRRIGVGYEHGTGTTAGDSAGRTQRLLNNGEIECKCLYRNRSK